MIYCSNYFQISLALKQVSLWSPGWIRSTLPGFPIRVQRWMSHGVCSPWVESSVLTGYWLPIARAYFPGSATRNQSCGGPLRRARLSFRKAFIQVEVWIIYGARIDIESLETRRLRQSSNSVQHLGVTRLVPGLSTIWSMPISRCTRPDLPTR